jgi:histidinol dehydrogenase
MSGTVAEIVADVRKRGDAALTEWALELDGVAPARAEPQAGLPEEAVLVLAERVRRWHEAQRPTDLRLEIEPGELGGAVPRWRRRGSTFRALVSALVMRSLRAGVVGSSSSRPAAPGSSRRLRSSSASTRFGPSAGPTRSPRSPTARSRSRASTRSPAPGTHS